ncbi:MAG: hypothetical protein PVI26_12885, partial [Chitinispirillia bacterium]
MEITFELIIALFTGFTVGCFITTLISILLYSSHQKKHEHNKQNRRSILNSIGTLSANIENAFSAYRIGTMKYHTLREIIIAKLNLINTALQGNLDILDPFYVKNIERFIDDQNKFLLIGEKENAEAAEVQTEKSQIESSFEHDQATPEKETVQNSVTEVIEPPKKQSEKDEYESVDVDIESEEFESPEKKSEEIEEIGKIIPDDSEKEQIEIDSAEKKELLSSFESGATACISIDQVEEFIQPSTESKETEIIEEASVKTEEEHVEPVKIDSELSKDEIKDEDEEEEYVIEPVKMDSELS